MQGRCGGGLWGAVGRVAWADYRAVRLISVAGKITERVLREAIAMHVKEKEVIGKSQQKYTVVLDHPDCLL